MSIRATSWLAWSLAALYGCAQLDPIQQGGEVTIRIASFAGRSGSCGVALGIYGFILAPEVV
jgi:hypothetical protein